MEYLVLITYFLTVSYVGIAVLIIQCPVAFLLLRGHKPLPEAPFVEVFLVPNSVTNRLIDLRIAREDVVPELCERRIHAVDATLGLLEISVTVRQTVEANCVRISTIPPFGTATILYEVGPRTRRFRRGLVLVPVPLPVLNLQ